MLGWQEERKILRLLSVKAFENAPKIVAADLENSGESWKRMNQPMVNAPLYEISSMFLYSDFFWCPFIHDD